MAEYVREFDGEELTALAGFDIERNDLEAALRKLKTAVARAEAPAEGVAMIARVYAQLRLWKKAREYFERYLQLVPDSPTEVFQLGMVYFDMNEPARARSLWEELLGAQPTHPPALFYSALVNAQQGRRADALRHLEVLLKSAPVDNLYFGRGRELMQSLEQDGAAAADAGHRHETEH